MDLKDGLGKDLDNSARKFCIIGVLLPGLAMHWAQPCRSFELDSLSTRLSALDQQTMNAVLKITLRRSHCLHARDVTQYLL